MSRLHPLHLLVLLSVCTFWACEKVALTAPTGSTLTLAISTTSVPINGSADVIATVIEAGGTAAHNGTMVTFSASFGRLEPPEAPTSGGRAVVKFIGNSSGVARISAFSGAATAEITDVRVGGAAAGAVAMRAEPASLPQGGGTVQILAVVRDDSGNPLPGAPVSFTTDQGNLGATSAITDANGQAQSSLTTNRDAVVTATVIAAVTATTNVRIINAPAVTITTNTTNPGVGVGVNFTVTPGDIANGASIQSASINFGDGTPEQNLSAISGATNVTHTFQSPGSYTVIASVVDATGQRGTSSISVVVQRIAPTVTLTPASSTITVGGAVAFSVTATSGAGGPPIQGVVVRREPGGAVVYSGSANGSFIQQFGSAGTYSFTATATDTSGSTGSASAVVTVGAGAGVQLTLDASGGTLTCTSTYPKTCEPLTAGTTVVFTAGGTTASSYEWTWGDGSSTETTTSQVNSHTYAAAGTFVATVRANGVTAAITLRP